MADETRPRLWMAWISVKDADGDEAQCPATTVGLSGRALLCDLHEGHPGLHNHNDSLLWGLPVAGGSGTPASQPPE